LARFSKHARRNVSRAFPELSETEIARVVAGMWDNLGRLAAEYPHLQLLIWALLHPFLVASVGHGCPAGRGYIMRATARRR
jgi:lauroyl/myristoyl acyltransferase